jgi:anti-sigma regulatory factor (Ser/Thr protein kinase)
LSLRVPADVHAPAAVRARLETWLAGLGWPEGPRDDLVLAISEAVSNSVEHGYDIGPDRPGSADEVTVTGSLLDGGAERRVVLTVVDAGRWRPQPAVRDHRRHGLPIMRACAEELTVAGTQQGTTVVLRSLPVSVDTRLDGLAAHVRATAPRCGRTRLVCVDGPSGSGKSTLAGQLAPVLGGAPVLAMDDLYPGWDGLAASVPLLHDQVVAPLTAGLPAGYRRWDWDRSAWAEHHDIGTPDVLIVEGVGCGSRLITPFAVLMVWMEAPEDIRFGRGIARDGQAYRPHWERWAAQEQALFAAEGTRARADVVLTT